MGLDFQGSDVHFSYSGFMEFRRELARSIGMDLDTMVAFGGSTLWPKPEEEGLVPLLYHSDCDGELTPREMAFVFPRLREICLQWPEDSWHRQRALQLADDMEALVKADENLEFC